MTTLITQNSLLLTKLLNSMIKMVIWREYYLLLTESLLFR